MHVFISPQFTGQDNAHGGIRRVWEAQVKYFPDLGIEIVDHPNKADLVACHATEYVDHPIVVSHIHGLYWHGYPWMSWAIKANQKLIEIMKVAKVVTSPSEWVANSIRRGMLLDPVVCQHGIDVDEWTPPKQRGNYAIWAKTRVDPICNPYDMNKLAEKAAGIQFVSTFGKETDNVHLIGALPLEQIKPYIQHAAYYLATVRETGAITLLEAMSSGVVPVGWNWGANSGIVEHKVTGYLAYPGDYEDLLEGLLYCKTNQAELSANARQAAVEKFQWKDVIGNYKTAYDLALQEPGKGPAVSVIVTAYNLDKYLSDCLNSVLAQDFSDWELIVVDDASPDNCGRIADVYAERDPRIKVVHNRQNSYLAESRNIGIRVSTGRYIVPLDADDRLGVGALKTLVGALDTNPSLDIVTGSVQFVEEDGVTPWRSSLTDENGISRWPSRNPNFSEQIREHNQVPYSSMYKRQCWEHTGGYRRRYKTAEDAEFWTRLMSFGAIPAKVTDNPTLVYRNRSASMSHQEPAIRWTSWFSWATYPELTPYAASGEPPKDELCWPVNAYGPTEVSVVIPCGPGHDWYLQDALDSLVAQTFLNWEGIVVNDTGKKWFDGDKLINPYLAGFPWVKVIDSDGTNHGVAWARTTGTAAAKSPLVFYLDADDYLQPAALDVLVKAQKQYGGWVYSDWYDQNMQLKQAQDWDADGLVIKMLGPMTGLYPRDAMLAVMFEDFGGWEDWDAQLSLLERGICGTHIALPLFVYRYDTGTRREDNYKKAEDLLQYIKEKHSRLYKESDFMAGCRKCGGGGGRSKITVGVAQGARRNPQADNDMVLVEYVGPMTQFQRIKSKAKPGAEYRFGGNPGADSRKFYIFKKDADHILASAMYQIVPEVVQETLTTEDIPVLEAHTRPAPVLFDDFLKELDTQIVSKMGQEAAHMTPVEPVPVVDETHPISMLKISPETISILEAAGLDTVELVRDKSIAQLITIKGIGSTRAAKIISAAAEVLG